MHFEHHILYEQLAFVDVKEQCCSCVCVCVLLGLCVFSLSLPLSVLALH